jgi:hypothetical protein
MRVGRQDRLAKDIESFRLEIWLAMHEDLRATQRVRLLFDHLAKDLASHVGRPKGATKPAGVQSPG